MNLNVPGLAGWIAAKEQAQQESMNNMKTYGVLQDFVAKNQAQQRDLNFRREIAAATTPEERVAVAARYGGPDAVMKAQQMAVDKQAGIEAQRATAQARLEQQSAYANMMHEFRMANARTAEERTIEQARHNKQMEALQAQNAATNAELRRLTLGLQADRQTQALADKENKEIEGQIGKTSDRMKDLMPVWTSANQLNGILSRYTPDTVPGLGYLKNTDAGKILLSPEGKDVSSSIKLFGNSVLKAMSGAAVTAPEEIRQMAAQMADGRFSAQDFYIAWPKMSQWVNDQMKLGTAGLNPKAKERFLERTGLKLDPITPRFSFDGGSLVDSQAPRASSGMSFGSVAEAEAAAKAGKIKKGDKITVGGQSGTWK